MTNAKKIEIVEAGRIAKTIQHIHPNIAYEKALEYGRSILKASLRYGIESNLLVSIAHQESTFREDLPEGKAGELGICQIRKMWVNNPKFQREFGIVKEKELLKPERNFLFAAWILRDLRDSRKDGVVPYWSYYNANKFHNRVKYYTLVNRFLAAIKNKRPVERLRRVPTVWDPSKIVRDDFAPMPTEPKRPWVIGIANSEGQTFKKNDGLWRPVAHEVKYEPKPASDKGWVPAALRKLQSRKTPGSYDHTVAKAAFNLDIPSLFNALPVMD